MRTNGMELSMDFNHQFKNGLTLSVAAGVSDSKSVIVDYRDEPTHTFMYPNDYSWGTRYYTGQTLGEIWGYTYDRLYQVNDFEEITELDGTSVPSGERPFGTTVRLTSSNPVIPGRDLWMQLLVPVPSSIKT